MPEVAHGRPIIPPNLLCHGDLIDEMYEASISSDNIDNLRNMASLAPKNVDVDTMNKKILGRVNVSNVGSKIQDSTPEKNNQRFTSSRGFQRSERIERPTWLHHIRTHIRFWVLDPSE